MDDLALSLEPRMEPDGGVRVGETGIPRNVSLLTALLRGYATHRHRPEALDYYFWRIAEELWSHEGLADPLLERNPWAERIIYEFHRNKFLAIGGAANSGKSYVMASAALVSWLSSPHDTLVLMTSTTLKAARQRIWGAVMTLASVVEDIPGRVRDSMGSINFVDSKGVLFDRAGLTLVAAEKSRTREAIGKFIGIKQTNVIVVADELSEISQAIINACLSNLNKNPRLQVTGLSNPDSPFDAFGDWACPKGGWDSIDPLTADEWTTQYNGKYIRFDGERSPNVILKEDKWKGLPTLAKLEEDRELLGVESRGYMRMDRAVFFFGDEASGVYSDADLTQSGAMRQAEWAGSPTVVAGLDPAFTNGGDRTVLSVGRVGYERSGQFVFEFGETFSFDDDATDKATPRTYQIARKVKEVCLRLKIDPENLMVDSTGAGNPFCDVLAGEWSPAIRRVVFGGVPSDLKVSSSSRLTGKDVYTNRVTEMWFAGRELLRTKQIRGVKPDLAQELVARRYDLLKSGSLKMKLEPKPEFKARFGRSPDLADGGFLALAAARHYHGLLPIDPPVGKNGEAAPHMIPKRRTFKGLMDAMDNPDATLLDV